jgi:predicted secreted Zn-dependent protease
MHPAALILAVKLASSSPAVVERVEYYEVFALSATLLRAEINKVAPKDDQGRRSDAVTDWTVRWDYRYDSRDGACAITAFSTSVAVLTRLPSLAVGAPKRLVEQWDKYVEALTEHERGHARIGIQAATAIQDRASALASTATCGELERAIKAKGEALVDEYRGRDIDYDRRTKHGITQGATFP